MCTGVAGANGCQPMFNQVARHFFVGQQSAQMLFHLRAVSCDEVIASGLKQLLDIGPRRTDEWNTAGECFKRANCRNPGEQLNVWPPRNMNRDFDPRETLRHTVVRQPTAVADAGIPKQLECVLWITNAEYLCAEAERLDRFNEEFAKLGCALLITPVANPNEVAIEFISLAGKENVCVGCFVPRPGRSGDGSRPVKVG